jgi:hypothetical protein
VGVFGDGVQLAREDCQAREAGDGLEAVAGDGEVAYLPCLAGELRPGLGATDPCNFVRQLP